MANIENIIYEMYKYGNYAIHYYNYVKENSENEDIKIFTDIILKRKQGKHKEALRLININLSFIKNNNIYYLLLCMKMHILFFYNREDYKITYKIIKKNLDKIPPLAREILKPNLIAIESETNHFKNSRFWGKNTLKNNYFKSSYLFSLSKQEENFKVKRRLLSKSMNIAKKIPNPSIIIDCLFNLRETYKEDRLIKKYISTLYSYYTAYYTNNFEEIKKSFENFLVDYKDFDNKKYYTGLTILDKIKSMRLENYNSSINLNKKSYDLNDEIISFLKKMKDQNIFNENDFSRITLYSLINKKNNHITSNTVRKILQIVDDKELPEEFKLEQYKMFVDSSLKKIFHEISDKSDKDVLLETVSTFLAYPKPNSKSHKYIEYIINLKNFSPKRLLNLNYDYKLIILLSFFEDLSPYIKARKSLIKNSLRNLKYENLKTAFITYISASKEKRIYTERFLLYLSRFNDFPNLNDEKYNLNIDNHISNKSYINALYGFDKNDRKKAFNILLRTIKYGN